MPGRALMVMVTWGGLPCAVPRLRRAVGVVAVVVGVVAEGSALGPEVVAGELCPSLMYIWRLQPMLQVLYCGSVSACMRCCDVCLLRMIWPVCAAKPVSLGPSELGSLIVYTGMLCSHIAECKGLNNVYNLFAVDVVLVQVSSSE